jgi:hypothetical protein
MHRFLRVFVLYIWPMIAQRFLGIFLLIAAIACNKKNTTENDKQAPLITIATPTNNQQFTGGQSIGITGTITDNSYIAEVHIHVSNASTGSLLMDVHLYPASDTINFSQILNASAGINYKITVTAKDKAVNEESSSVNVSAN